MEKYRNTLLQIWREAARHVEIDEAADTIAPLLADKLPLSLLLIRTLNVARQSLDTIASSAASASASARGHRTPHSRSTLSPSDVERILAWSMLGQVLHDRSRAGHTPPYPLLPEEVKGDYLAAPLGTPGAPRGILILVARRGAHFEKRHIPMVSALREPFATALENDQRVRDLASLREAAEADKLTLLNRLGRADVADSVVGADAGLKPVMARVDLVARSDVPVLILGETGSGKEVVARAIHQRSPRARGPFLRVNCGAIPSELIDSELFGHERGSFTGAVEQRKGWFERADTGTLFLDEIGELPPAAQVRFLRILQDGAFERVGGHTTISVNVRIVAATHRDLRAMIRDGRFREDLWYRIAVFPIDLPPLRARPEDIPALAAHFALRASKRFGTPAILPTPEDTRLLMAYDWPGNARELGAVMERAVILGDGHRLDVVHALGNVQPSSGQRAAPPILSAPPGRLSPSTPDVLPLDAAMAAHIESALRHAAGRIEGRRGAAALLRINPHTLRARMRKLGIDWAKFRPPPDDDAALPSHNRN